MNISSMSKIKRKIIRLLAYHPEREFYAQEVAEKTACSKASATTILKELADKKIVYKEKRGHMKFYQVNPESMDVKRFKIDLVLENINSLLSKLKNVSRKIILFGSASRGEQTADSDIDLLILTNDKDRVQKILSNTSQKLGVKPFIKTPSEWSQMEVTNPEFYREVNGGITLYEYVSRI